MRKKQPEARKYGSLISIRGQHTKDRDVKDDRYGTDRKGSHSNIFGER